MIFLLRKSDIAPLRSAVILYSPCIFNARSAYHVRRTYHALLHRTRRKANITEKSTSANRCAFFWLRNQDLNPDEQSQSLLCYHYTIPHRLNGDNYSKENGVCQGIFKIFFKKEKTGGKAEQNLPRSRFTGCIRPFVSFLFFAIFSCFMR